MHSPLVLATTLAVLAASATAKFKNIVYFTEWGSLPVADIDWSRITHVNYAFAKPESNGTITFGDAWAAFQRVYPGDNANKTRNLFGHFGQAYKLKSKFRQTKFGLSLGGWTWSAGFSDLASTEAGRKTFVQSAIDIMENLGLDFIDLDWEFPVDGGDWTVPHRPEDIENLILVLKEFRFRFSGLSYPAEISIASPGGPYYYRHWDFGRICPLLDRINVMNYDYAGGWNTYTDHAANLYKDPKNPYGSGVSNHDTIQAYIKGGCAPSKIVMGIPLYGPGFLGTDGLFTKFSSTHHYAYKNLPPPGAAEIYDKDAGAAYSWNNATRELVSYDSPKSMATKLEYIKANKLGGTMYWSVDADAPANSGRSLVTQAYNFFGKTQMDFRKNNLGYPNSKYPNVRGWDDQE